MICTGSFGPKSGAALVKPLVNKERFVPTTTQITIQKTYRHQLRVKLPQRFFKYGIDDRVPLLLSIQLALFLEYEDAELPQIFSCSD